MDTTSSTRRAGFRDVQGHCAYDRLLALDCLQPLTRVIARTATSDVPVLIVGESGTGKELVAQAIHEKSFRSAMPFVCLNLAAVPVELAETVLFGHAKGAFTGASHSSPGYCRKADGGTLFLDEIGEADLSPQAKLLRFLQNGEIQPVGSASVVTVDTRVVAATNRDLERAVRDKEFREDLFYRLNVVQISIPPLRRRAGDFDHLIDLFLAEFNSKYHRACTLTNSLREHFRNARWPGNIRQLRSVIESLIILSEHENLGIHDLTSEFLSQIGTQSPTTNSTEVDGTVPELERLTHHLVETVVEQSNGNVAKAAKRLGISRATLYRWLKKYRTSVHDS